MQPDHKTPAFNANPQAGGGPLPLPTSAPPMIGVPPPPLPPKPNRKPWPVRQMLAVLLSIYIWLFLADAVVSLIAASLIFIFDLPVFVGISGILSLFAMLMAILIYGLMGLTPMIPKRLFLPLTFFYPLAVIVVIPFLIFFYGRIQLIGWVISFCQVILGLSIIYRFQGGFKFRWPLVAENQLLLRRFSWRNLSVFLLVNVFVLGPALIVYFVFCTALAVDHFSEGFVKLRPGGLTVQVRKYVRDDGKTIQLFPMSHVAESDFYHRISQTFPTNSIILMEGVTDNKNLLTNKISYKRMATSLGLAEQHEKFAPSRGEMVQADVDVEQFSTNTIDCLNLVMLIHSKGMNAERLMKLMQFSPPHFEEQLFDDLLRKRNRRLMAEIHARLSQSENIIVPWGVAHMPEIAREIQKSGFRLEETREYVAIRFGSAGNKSKGAGEGVDSGKRK